MKYLETLTPAECLVLITTNGVITKKQMLKMTFVDLILKQVLKIQEEQHQAHPRDPVMTYKYVYPGSRFGSYFPLEHEQIFTNAFTGFDPPPILLRNFIKSSFASGDLVAGLVKSANLKDYFKRKWWNFFSGSYKRTDYGVEVRKKILAEISEIEQRLKGKTNQPRLVANIVYKINGNILLIEGIELLGLAQIDADLFKEMNANQGQDIADNSSGCATIAGCWSDLDSIGDSFDSSCSNDSSGCSGDSGCSSSGCSGCSGCGGGCGGD